MLIIKCIFIAILVVAVKAHYKPLSQESIYAIGNHTIGSKRYPWEMSGQYQGDMVLTEEQMAAIQAKNGLIDTRYRWPNKQIVVALDSALSADQRNSIESALNNIVQGTCLSWRYANGDTDYVYVKKNEAGCWSYVGRIGGRQNLNLQDPGCWGSGTVVHELLHAWGFDHMQCDPDRDEWVWIYWDNIIEEYKYAFDLSTKLTSFGFPYDYDSVMHYGPYSFAINSNNPTILRNREPYYQLGNDDGPTGYDIAKIKAMYEC